MASTVISSVVIDVKTKGNKQASSGISDTSKKVNQLSKNNEGASKSFTTFGMSAKTAALSIGSIATVAVATLTTINLLSEGIASQRRELIGLAQAGKTTANELMVLGNAGREFGVTAEQIGDQFKDLQDKLGDFTTTGAGPFSEVLNLLGENTREYADQLATLSGPQLLQKLNSEAQKANLTLSEQTFIWETLGSDVSKTVQIFQNNNSVLDKSIERYGRFNLLLSQTTNTAISEVADSANTLGLAFDAFSAKAIASLNPVITKINIGLASALASVSDTLFGNEFSAGDIMALETLTEVEVRTKSVTNAIQKETELLQRKLEINKRNGILETNSPSIQVQREKIIALQTELDLLDKRNTTISQTNKDEESVRRQVELKQLLAQENHKATLAQEQVVAFEERGEESLRRRIESQRILKELEDSGIAMRDGELTSSGAILTLEQQILVAKINQFAAENNLIAAKELAAVATQKQQKQEAELAQQQQAGLQQLSQGMTSFLLNGKEGLAGFAKQLTQTIIQAQILKLLTATVPGLGAALGGVTAAANGMAINGGVQAFAKGGVVSGPTLFPMANGAGLMGEAGPEAIMPLKRGAGGKLGVAMSGGGGGMTVNNVINIGESKDPTETGNQVQMGMERAMKNSIAQTIEGQKRYGGALNPRNVLRSF